MTQTAYTVLATKYRPKTFDDLVGQEVLVRTLTNAIANNRIANAFLMTGIRGVGKTTTARIIARALNCIGADGNGNATSTPCGVCDHCLSIAQDRHPDVIEMDAASRTGVDDVRSIIDNANYLPTSARYKIYIIDEVHMLSKNAFNALLKTLEEPPAHVKFIFATTEIRKIPITILSRCQRFDLRRIDHSTLVNHLANIAEKEQADISKEALAVIADASEGSVRDSLSLLDQAIAHSQGAVDEQAVRQMIGLADPSRLASLFEAIISGQITQALDVFHGLYHDGADPFMIISELLEYNHLITKVKITPNASETTALPEAIVQQAQSLAKSLGIAYLSRCWQMLLKGLNEVKLAPNSLIAAEMLLIRLAHLSDLPSPESLIKQVKENSTPSTSAVDRALAGVGASPTPTAHHNALVQPHMHEEPQPITLHNFEALVALFKEKGEILLHSWLMGDVKLVKFEQGKLEFNPSPSLPSDFAARISQHLNQWTGSRWTVVISSQEGQASLHEQVSSERAKQKERIMAHPDIQNVLQTFPNATIVSVENVNKEDKS